MHCIGQMSSRSEGVISATGNGNQSKYNRQNKKTAHAEPIVAFSPECLAYAPCGWNVRLKRPMRRMGGMCALSAIWVSFQVVSDDFRGDGLGPSMVSGPGSVFNEKMPHFRRNGAFMLTMLAG